MFPRQSARWPALSVLVAALALPCVAAAQTQPSAVVVPPSSYASMADVAIAAETIVDARIRRARPVPAEQAVGIPPHLVRLYVEADVNTVIYGNAPLARRVGFLVDQPRRADGRPPRLDRTRVLLFARPVAVSNRLQLVTPQALRLWDAARDATVRSIVAERSSAPVPPEITGISQAFHVRGTVAGESETQIFLTTASGDPVSLTILRRPGESARWAVAFGEIVDESATIPQPRTLGWYRLACGLPRALPSAALASLDSNGTRAAAQDYALVLRSLGACDRDPPPAPPAPPAPRG